MKLTLSFEIEISDIPEKDRLEMLNDAGMSDEDMPRISAMSETQVRAEVTDAFYAMFDGSNYDDQSDMWAGSNFYGYITSIIAAPSPQADLVGRYPIESAPKDGTWFLAYRGPAPGGTWDRYVIVRWHEEFDDFVWPDDPFDIFTDDIDEKRHDGRHVYSPYESSGTFTHWSPLPIEDGSAPQPNVGQLPTSLRPLLRQPYGRPTPERLSSRRVEDARDSEGEPQ
ncbi:hypothetical protein [Rhizobium sp. 9140]|uniref:hypothetical protein n=1 Tax=Rhizobium sp. 9140 TaxID=1761900 RepID=UPI0007928F8D|nr:hypothetical protein [Rhizobium sp. 9140]CZT36387.1 hypothetical protein GA0004734_00033860 [Rhizobium sp. 9140]